MHCKNCNTALKDTQKFCDECGAKVIQNRLTPKVLAHQVNEQFISIDNKFLRTFIDLFRQPEVVIVGYIEGTRKKYIDVLQYFAISLTLAGIQVFLMNTFFEESIDFQKGFMEGFNASSTTSNNPFENIDFNSWSKYQGLIYILMVPFYALGSWLTYYIVGDRIYNFTEHLVINLYYNAQIIITTAVLSILFLISGLDYLIITTVLTIPFLWYFFFLLKRIFKNSFWNTFARFLMTMVIGFISMLIISLIVVVIIVLITLVLHK